MMVDIVAIVEIKKYQSVICEMENANSFLEHQRPQGLFEIGFF